jgi:hypothetical protein
MSVSLLSLKNWKTLKSYQEIRLFCPLETAEQHCRMC